MAATRTTGTSDYRPTPSRLLLRGERLAVAEVRPRGRVPLHLVCQLAACLSQRAGDAASAAEGWHGLHTHPACTCMLTVRLAKVSQA
mmetsp:Transcript_148103/g.369233  ORF Transcript_148103/g.369233 Transcript_148103/m.369233 type:complete len:87 (-) Transcript_148103:7-267(-)